MLKNIQHELPLKSPVSATTTVCFLSWSRADSIFRRLSGDTVLMIGETGTLLYTPDTWGQEDWPTGSAHRARAGARHRRRGRAEIFAIIDIFTKTIIFIETI